MTENPITVPFRKIGGREFSVWDEDAPTFPCGASVRLNILTPNGKLQITVSTDGEADTCTILRGATRRSKWRELYSGPLPTDDDAIYRAVAETAARKLAIE